MVLPVLVSCASTPLTQRTSSCELANHHTNRVFQFNLSLCLLVNVSPLTPGASVHPRNRGRGPNHGPIESRTLDVGVS